MENSIDIKKIKKFLSNECDYVEAEAIAAYLQQHIAELDALDIFTATDGSQEPLSQKEKDRLFYKITHSGNAPVIILRRMLAAACMLAAIIGAFFLFNMKKPHTAPATAQAPQQHTIINTDTALMHIALPDGSLLMLKPQASVTYKQNFTDKRDLFLQNGDVYFNVFKNVAKPFVVHANGIKTTALGTAFWVENNIRALSVKVKLQEGKVALVSEDKYFSMDSVYLMPLQECWINKASGMVKVVMPTKNNKAGSARQTKAEPAPTAADNTVLWTNDNLQFTKTKLDNVLRKLESRYNVTIVVDEKYINRATLTGRILYSDSLNTIIKSICDINHLKYERRNDSIFLTR